LAITLELSRSIESDQAGRESNMDLGLKGARFSSRAVTRGIGRAIAETFAAEGANVAICSRNQADVDSAVAALKAKGATAFGGSLDVSMVRRSRPG
jgi:hypothetical protein